MGKGKIEPPTTTFPYKIHKRLNMLSVPRKYILETGADLPPLTPTGTRVSALTGYLGHKNSDIAWPYLRRLMVTKKMYRKKFSPERLQRVNRSIEASNATTYAKLANFSFDFKKKDLKKRKAWTDSEWKKHMEYIGMIAAPKKLWAPPPIKRGESKPLDALMPRINVISSRPDFKCYRRLSEEDWYRDPEKVSPGALKYVISERTKKLAVARGIPHSD